jgi:hypothetical protein
MMRIHLFHWNAAEAEERAMRLRAAGYAVDSRPLVGPGLRALRQAPPDAAVIDLSRLPSHGREVGVFLRHQAATRHVPIVYVGGEPEKVARVQGVLPDAVYTSWEHIRGALRQAIAHPPAAPVAPRSLFAVYAGVPLAQKLGIRPGWEVFLMGAPKGFADLLDPLPEGARLIRQTRKPRDIILWFIRYQKDLDSRLERVIPLMGEGGLWILWPKKGASIPSDLTQVSVRRTGLAAGLVDYKVCAVDATWTGLRFTRRKPR